MNSFRKKNIVLLALVMTCALAHAQVGTAVRELPFDFHPGDLIEVRIEVSPPPGTTNWSVTESYPDYWDFVSSTNASATNEFDGTVNFGPFMDDAPRTLDYQLSSIQELTNSVNFTGKVFFDRTTYSVTGTTFLPARNEWLFSGPIVFESGEVAGLAYGANRWVASCNGWVSTLETGGRLTYPRATRHAGEGWSRLAHVGGLFLLFGSGYNGAQMSISDDGLSWKDAQDEAGDTHPDPFAQSGGYIRSVAYGNGVYLAVGEHLYSPDESQWAGAIFRSTNGYNWKRVFRLLLPARDIFAVTFANNRFIAVAEQGTVLTSTNGLDWEETRPIRVTGDSGGTNSVWMNTDLRGIGYGSAGWIISTAVAGTSLRSVDGENWTALTGTGSGTLFYWQSFYADGKYYFSDFLQAYTTSDGTSWTQIPSPIPAYSLGPVSHAPDGVDPLYLAGGLPQGGLYASTNGISWTTFTPSVNAVWPRYLSVAAFNNEWVVSSQGEAYAGVPGAGPNDRGGNNIWIPIIGINNIDSNIRTNGQWRQGAYNVAYAYLLNTTNGILATGVDTSSRPYAGFLAGTNYTLSAPLLPYLTRYVPQQNYKGIVFSWENVNAASIVRTPTGFDLFIEAISTGDYDGYSIMNWGHFTSTNGSDWALRANGLNDATNFPGIRGLAWGAGRFVAVSAGYSPGTSTIISANRIYTSTNGEDYLPVDISSITPSLSEGLTGVTYADGKFMAIGNAGRILSSTNGLNWETVYSSDNHWWNRVRYLNGIWAVVGNAGWVAFSADGKNWISKTSGTESDLNDIAYQNGNYMMVGSCATVLTSLAVQSPIVSSDSLVKSLETGLQFKVNGQAGKILDVQSSVNLINWTTLFLTTNTTGIVIINDPEPNQGRRFYRTIQLP